MYLVLIDKDTGLVNTDDVHDGVLAIKAFKEFIDHDEFGLEAFTCVALATDHQSPIRHYPFKERHLKAMRVVTGDQNAFPWKNNLIQEACKIYSELQFNPDLEEMEELNRMRMNKLDQVKKETDEDMKVKLIQEQNKIKSLIKETEKSLDRNSILNNAPTKSGYTLTRLEEKLTNKKTFYHVNEKERQRPRGKKTSESADS